MANEPVVTVVGTSPPIRSCASLPTGTPSPTSDGQQRFQHHPLRVGQVEPRRHRYAGHLIYLINDTPTRPPPTSAGQDFETRPR
jgi:hypothetical protein